MRLQRAPAAGNEELYITICLRARAKPCLTLMVVQVPVRRAPAAGGKGKAAVAAAEAAKGGGKGAEAAAEATAPKAVPKRKPAAKAAQEAEGASANSPAVVPQVIIMANSY